MATAMRLHAMGWRSVYHNEVLAKGLAPKDRRSSLQQRLRWAQGTIQVMLRDNPLFVRGLSFGQKLMYFATMWSYLSGFPSLVYLAGEIAANIARHAYAIGVAGTMRLRLRLYPDRVEARFTDRGVAFRSPSELLEALSADTAQLPESGFGLSIASAAVDDLRYNRTATGTNSWRLVKRLPA